MLKSELTCCNIKFEKPYFLERHISAVHRMEKPYVCRYCGVGFSQKYNCGRHEETKCKNKKPL